MDEIKDDNKFLVGILVLGIVCVIAWICHDIGRNKPIYESTDVILDTIEVRVDDAGKRTDAIKNRVVKAEESVKQSANQIAGSREDAETIANGLAGCEARVDNLIQGHGRIKNIISEIERTNK